MTRVIDEQIELRGLRFHYRDWAASKAPAQDLVLLHGYTGHARSWDHFAEAMSDRYRVLALDQRGHGESGWAPDGAYDHQDLVDDLQAFVDAMQLKNFVLLGLSMGGIVAYSYAGTEPGTLERLVIVDIAPDLSPIGLARIQSSVARTDRFATKEEAFLRAREDNSVPPEAHQRLRSDQNLMRTEDGAWTYRYDRALRNPDNPRQGPDPAAGWDALARIAVPTLLVRGEDSDLLDRETATRFRETVKDCTLAEVAGAGHSVPLDQPEGFLTTVRDWLR